MEYSIVEHRHRFAAWAAASAASVRGCRFSIQRGKEILEGAGMNLLLTSADRLPAPEQTGEAHRQWRARVIQVASGCGPTFTHGVAAKLLNVYLKAAFVCGGQQDHPSVRALHPPIDSALLEALCEQNVGGLRADWRTARRIRWSKLSSGEDEAVIRSIRQAMSSSPLWEVEQYWRGYQ